MRVISSRGFSWFLACEQAFLFGRVKRVSRERGPSLARSREARFACPNRRACSQATWFPTFSPVLCCQHFHCFILSNRSIQMTVVHVSKACGSSCGGPNILLLLVPEVEIARLFVALGPKGTVCYSEVSSWRGFDEVERMFFVSCFARTGTSIGQSLSAYSR